MRDAGGIADVCVAALASELPRKIPLLRTAHGWSEVELPLAEQINSGEITDNALKNMGATWVAVLTPRLFKTDQVDIDPYGLPVYMNRYTCKFNVWAKAESWNLAREIRNRLVLATRLSLLEWPNMVPGTYGDTGFRLHRNTLTEEYFTPMRVVAGGRVWAPGLLTVDIDAEESLRDGSTRDPIGSADTVAPESFAVGPSQPLPETL